MANAILATSTGGNPSQEEPFPSTAGRQRSIPAWLAPLWIAGRIPRWQWWSYLAGFIVVQYAMDWLLKRDYASGLALLPFELLSAWILFAAQVRRWHDMDKSGLWIIIVLVPIGGVAWLLAELGLLRGTKGPNYYGDDPLAPSGGAADASSCPTA